MFCYSHGNVTVRSVTEFLLKWCKRTGLTHTVRTVLHDGWRVDGRWLKHGDMAVSVVTWQAVEPSKIWKLQHIPLGKSRLSSDTQPKVKGFHIPTKSDDWLTSHLIKWWIESINHFIFHLDTFFIIHCLFVQPHAERIVFLIWRCKNTYWC